MSQVHIQIQKSLIKHQADLNKVEMFSNAYYYAKTMITRCEEALKIEDANSAWKHLIG